jgi:hypothetical protein
MPELDASLADRLLWDELVAGVERLQLLVDALAVLEAELTASGSDALGPVTDAAAASARAALLTRLATAHPETACDAEAVLTLGPVRRPHLDSQP